MMSPVFIWAARGLFNDEDVDLKICQELEKNLKLFNQIE